MPWLAESTGAFHTNNNPGEFCLIICIFLFRDWAFLLPAPLVQGRVNKHYHENNPLSMEDTGHPLSLHERYKQMFI